jgi:hypothetical protein
MARSLSAESLPGMSQYNMGGTVLHWVTHAKPTEQYVLILDSDMILLRPISPADLGLRPGRGHAAYYGYLKGVNNPLAEKHIPEISPRNDELAGPKGRRADQVGGKPHERWRSVKPDEAGQRVSFRALKTHWKTHRPLHRAARSLLRMRTHTSACHRTGSQGSSP